MPKSPQEKAVDFTNSNAANLYRTAKKKQLPKAASLGWSVVRSIAEEVFANGGLAPLVKEEVMKWASSPAVESVSVEKKDKIVRQVPGFMTCGKVPRRAGGD